LEVPFLRKSLIEKAALNTVEGFYKMPCEEIPLPIDVDELLESFKLHFEMADLRQRFTTPDILGALDVQRSTVWVDASLDPFEYPDKIGRYRFTVAHELGHWILHREVLSKDREGQTKLHLDVINTPNIICRSYDTHSQIEWQANQFAASLLMPAPLFTKHYFDLFPRGLTESQSQDNSWEKETKLNQLCERFQVSRQAADIRIRDLKLDAPQSLLTPV
jgi:hypothetical protein